VAGHFPTEQNNDIGNYIWSGNEYGTTTRRPRAVDGLTRWR
jgi:adenylosuccinate synthase